ncbi:MAG TPA: fatty acid desaturase [Acidimicrobiales bacterium]|jgi:stearoyl-CoA desaturase (delta-9 desaturase)|nr:fatty acid desaturase [Acidimicrobiales bacterium]
MPPALTGVILGVCIFQVAGVATTVYLHRALAHRAMKVAPPLAALFRVVIWMSSGIRPRQWVAVHRKHHAFTDIPGDPHSPRLAGFLAVQFNNVGLYRSAARDASVIARYSRDIPQDRWDRLFLDRAWLGVGIAMAAIGVGLGWEVMLIAAAVHVVLYMFLNAAVNAVGHAFGKAPYPNTAFNNQWLAWLTVGEGLHNNHHAAPSSARLAHRRTEFDPGWWAILVLMRLKLVTVRHRGIRLRRTSASASTPASAAS